MKAKYFSEECIIAAEGTISKSYANEAVGLFELFPLRALMKALIVRDVCWKEIWLDLRFKKGSSGSIIKLDREAPRRTVSIGAVD